MNQRASTRRARTHVYERRALRGKIHKRGIGAGISPLHVRDSFDDTVDIVCPS